MLPTSSSHVDGDTYGDAMDTEDMYLAKTRMWHVKWLYMNNLGSMCGL